MPVSNMRSSRRRRIGDRSHRLMHEWVNGRNDGWREDNEWRRRSAQHVRESSRENAYQDESLWLVNGNDEDRRRDGGWNGRWNGRWNGGWNGRRGGRLEVLRHGRQDDVWNGRRNGRRNGRLVGWRVWKWYSTPRSSNRRTLPKLLLRWYKCCQRYYVDVHNDRYYMAHAVHHDHHGYIINRSSDSVGFDRRSTVEKRSIMAVHRRSDEITNTLFTAQNGIKYIDDLLVLIPGVRFHNTV